MEQPAAPAGEAAVPTQSSPAHNRGRITPTPQSPFVVEPALAEEEEEEEEIVTFRIGGQHVAASSSSSSSAAAGAYD